MSESAIGAAKTRFDELPAGKDTPDVVILITAPRPVLIALEAKVYDRPSTTALRAQLKFQRELLTRLARQLGDMLSEDVRLVHAALLPQQFAKTIGELGVPVLTWERLRDVYRDVAPPYFDAILATALARYPELASRSVRNQDAVQSGDQLTHDHLGGDPEFTWMGRDGGLNGSRLTADIQSGSWRSVGYESRRAALPNNRNWFPVADFIVRLQAEGQLNEKPA